MLVNVKDVRYAVIVPPPPMRVSKKAKEAIINGAKECKQKIINKGAKMRAYWHEYRKNKAAY
jgi:hypothetical protein